VPAGTTRLNVDVAASLAVQCLSREAEDNAMNASRTESLQSRLENVIALSGLLERVENTAISVDADQYRSLIRQLKSALSVPIPAPALDAILGAHPAVAELYENMNYETSGLSRISLDRSVATEMLASEVIARASRSARAG